MSLVLLQYEENTIGSYFEIWKGKQKVLYIHLTPWKLFSEQCLNECHVEEYFCRLQIVKYFESSSKNIFVILQPYNDLRIILGSSGSNIQVNTGQIFI